MGEDGQLGSVELIQTGDATALAAAESLRTAMNDWLKRVIQSREETYSVPGFFDPRQ